VYKIVIKLSLLNQIGLDSTLCTSNVSQKFFLVSGSAFAS
jgi:hypothetical protein